MNILITGGMGFIGSNFIGHIIDKEDVNNTVARTLLFQPRHCGLGADVPRGRPLSVCGAL